MIKKYLQVEQTRFREKLIQLKMKIENIIKNLWMFQSLGRRIPIIIEANSPASKGSTFDIFIYIFLN